MDSYNEWEQKYYLVIRKARDFFSIPIARILDKIGMTPNIVTIVGFVFFIIFFALLVFQNKYAILFLVVGLIMDMFDGALARVQNKSSDRGKFVDVLFDAINYIIFVLALIYAQFVVGIFGLVFIFLITLSKVLRMICHARIYKTDWYFKSVVGFVPIFIITLSYIFFGINYFYQSFSMDNIFLIFSIILIFDSAYFFKKIYSYNKV